MIRIQKYADFMNRGIFIPIGGAESLDTLKQVIDIIGNRINILVITIATSYKKDAEEKYTKFFNELDCNVNVLHADNRDEVDTEESLSKLENIELVFFTGGDQSKISTCLLGTEFLTRVKKKLKKGLVVSGTSAGAVAMSSHMIEGGKETPRVGAGLSLLPNFIIDSHFEERNRMIRLKKTVDLGGTRIGLGISEDSAVVINKNTIKVIGNGNTTLITTDGHKILKPGETFKI
jgi:cyanophycinase